MKAEIRHLSITANASSREMTADVEFECDTEGLLWLQKQIGKNIAPGGMSMAASSQHAHVQEQTRQFGWAGALLNATREMEAETAMLRAEATGKFPPRPKSDRENLLTILDNEGITAKK